MCVCVKFSLISDFCNDVFTVISRLLKMCVLRSICLSSDHSIITSSWNRQNQHLWESERKRERAVVPQKCSLYQTRLHYLTNWLNNSERHVKSTNQSVRLKTCVTAVLSYSWLARARCFLYITFTLKNLSLLLLPGNSIIIAAKPSLSNINNRPRFSSRLCSEEQNEHTSQLTYDVRRGHITTQD